MRARVLLCALLALTACAEWPRFANRPSANGVAGLGAPELDPGDPIDESLTGDWPGRPQDLVAEPVQIGALWDVTWFEGDLSEFGNLTDGDTVPFGCEPDHEVRGTYSGDVDFLKLDHNGGPLCLVLDADAGATPELTAWDLVLYDFEVDCLKGPFLTPAAAGDGSQPGWTVPGGVAWVTDALPGDLALYVAGARGAYDGPAPYSLFVVPVPTVDACASDEVLGLVGPDR